MAMAMPGKPWQGEASHGQAKQGTAAACAVTCSYLYNVYKAYKAYETYEVY